MTNFEFLDERISKYVSMKEIINEYEEEQCVNHIAPIKEKQKEVIINEKDEIDMNLLRSSIEGGFSPDVSNEMNMAASIAPHCNYNVKVIQKYMKFIYDNYKENLNPELYNNWEGGIPNNTMINRVILKIKQPHLSHIGAWFDVLDIVPDDEYSVAACEEYYRLFPYRIEERKKEKEKNKIKNDDILLQI